MGFINQQTSLGGTILQGHAVMGTRFFGSCSGQQRFSCPEFSWIFSVPKWAVVTVATRGGEQKPRNKNLHWTNK